MKKSFKKCVECFLMLALAAGICGCDIMGLGGNMKKMKASVLLTDEKTTNGKKVNGYGSKSPWESDEFNQSNEKMLDAQLALFRNLADNENNSMISPISILTALSMTENGAKGQTLTQMEDVFGIDNEEMTKWIGAWSSEFTGGEKVKVNLANSIWFKQGKEGENGGASFAPEEGYLKILAEKFGAQAYASDFSQDAVDDINNWCKKQTFDMIDKIIDRFNSNEVAVLLNAIAFDGKWKKQYEEDQVKSETFYCENGTKEEAKLMYSREDTYLHDDLATGFIKPYWEKYSYVAILPNEGVTVADYVSKLDGDRFANLLETQEDAVVYSFLPSYKSEYFRDDLKDVLYAMGIKDAFEPDKADFSGMGKSSLGNLFIGDVIHKTFIEVNEKGTKAAAVTKIGMKSMSVMPAPKNEYTVRLDRPFIYAIVDNTTNTPIFIGTVMSVKEGQ